MFLAHRFLHMAIQYPKTQNCPVCGSILKNFYFLQYGIQNALKQTFNKTPFLKVEQP